MPASKVSVPLTVVMRTAVNAAAKGIDPADILVKVDDCLPKTPASLHVFPVNKVNNLFHSISVCGVLFVNSDCLDVSVVLNYFAHLIAHKQQ